MPKKMTQKEMVLDHLKQGPITPLDALNLYGCFRLGAIIFDLRKEGWDITTENVKNPNGKTFAKYHLIAKAQPWLDLVERAQNGIR